MKIGTLHEVVYQEGFLDSLKSAGQSLIQKGKEAGQNLIQKGATKVHNTLYNNSSAYRAGFQQARQNMIPQHQQAANVARRVVPTVQKPTIQPPKPAPVVQKPIQQPMQQPVVQKTNPNVVNGRLQQPVLNRPKLNTATDPKTGITFSKQNGKLVSNAMQPQQPVQQQAQKAPSVTDPKTGVTYSKNPNGQYTATTKEYISPNGTVVNAGNGQVQRPNTPQQQPAPAKPISIQDPKTGITYTKHLDGTYTSTEKSYYYTKPGERYSSAYTHPDGSISVRDNQTGDIYTKKKNGQYTITSTKPKTQQPQQQPAPVQQKSQQSSAPAKYTDPNTGRTYWKQNGQWMESIPTQQPKKSKGFLGSLANVVGKAGKALKDHVSGESRKNAALRNALMQDQQKLQQQLQNR